MANYTYDVLGRATADTATTLASGVDGSVRRIGITFDTAGRPYQLISYNNVAGATSHAVNVVQRAYNGFVQLTSEVQSHAPTWSGSDLVTAGVPTVTYEYTEAASGANHSRLKKVI